MGSDFTPFFTNLLLWLCKSKWLKSIKNANYGVNRKYFITAGIFSNTFLLPVKNSKNSILSWAFEVSLLPLLFKKTSYQNVWKYEISKPTICFQSQLYLLISFLVLCLDLYVACPPLWYPRFIDFCLERIFFIY